MAPPRGKRYNHVISFRVDDVRYIRLTGLRATFPKAQWGEMMDWILELPEVGEAVRRRLEQNQPGQAKLPGARIGVGKMGYTFDPDLQSRLADELADDRVALEA